ncbi:hypothetical protein HBN50_02940 [Halobacteriovorax sp. GB3]|uniref:hypothetical protein n=1 Tax=Halobacteriovorax sp. GB3 TaxID=2719615 RepID=UPI0023620AB0|nr:hypothetical protein [Halobacteriovorax sp. GB3]MDD0852031.1 hypothetical protein [Halobacteriovorax sp. GB3]
MNSFWKKVTFILIILSAQKTLSAEKSCHDLLEAFHRKVVKTTDFQGLKILPMKEVLEYASQVKYALEIRKEYFNTNKPWEKFHDIFPHNPAQTYYRVMTLDKDSLEHILRNGIEPEKASSWDGHYISTGVRLNYGVAASNFRGNILKVDGDHLILNIIFQFDADKLPWPSSDRPKVAGRLKETIPVEAITNVWAYDLQRNDIFQIGSRTSEKE